MRLIVKVGHIYLVSKSIFKLSLPLHIFASFFDNQILHSIFFERYYVISLHVKPQRSYPSQFLEWRQLTRETLKSLQSGRNKITNSKSVITSYLRINYWQRNAVFASIPLMSVMICNPRNNLVEPSQFSTL